MVLPPSAPSNSIRYGELRSIAASSHSLASTGGSPPILYRIWQPKTPAGFAFESGVGIAPAYFVPQRRARIDPADRKRTDRAGGGFHIVVNAQLHRGALFVLNVQIRLHPPVKSAVMRFPIFPPIVLRLARRTRFSLLCGVYVISRFKHRVRIFQRRNVRQC